LFCFFSLSPSSTDKFFFPIALGKEDEEEEEEEGRRRRKKKKRKRKKRSQMKRQTTIHPTIYPPTQSRS